MTYCFSLYELYHYYGDVLVRHFLWTYMFFLGRFRYRSHNDFCTRPLLVFVGTHSKVQNSLAGSILPFQHEI